MTTMLTLPALTISKAALNQAEGVVILSIKEYQKLKEQSVPTYHLKGRAAKALDNLVTNGLKEYKQGKFKTLTSLDQLD